MGDPCSTTLLNIVLSKSVDAICQCFGAPQPGFSEESGSFLHLEENWRSLQEERENLAAKDAEIKAQVESEENRLNICNDDVKLWQKRVVQTLQNIVTQDEEYEELARCLCNCTPNLVHRRRVAKRVMENLQKVRRLAAEGRAFTSVAHEPQPDIVEERPATQRPKGMDLVMKQLHTYFTNTEKSIIGIHGLGGVGKTTLINEFNNSLKNNDFFQVVIFIELSYPESLNIEDMQYTIADRVGMPWNDSQSVDERARLLLKALKRKKFVVLLDDVRREFKLEKVGIPPPNVENKCKLILTSRSQDVCIQMGAQSSMIEVKCLDKEPAWDLFQSNLSENAIAVMKGDDAIKRHAEAIVNMCGGLPLALNVIGKSVASLTSPNEWRSAAETLTASPSYLPGMEDYLFNPLKYSYDQLKSMHKQCFLYCALFPEYGSIKKDQLIEYWMAEGLATGPAEGRQIISILVSASLLERGDKESRVKMHDIIRKLALWLASDCGTKEDSSFLVQAGLGLIRAPAVRKWKAATRISLMSNDISVLPDSPNCSNLSTLLLQNNLNLLKLPQNLFKSMPLLRVLDLSHTAIEAFPIGANVLGQLEHLNLSNTRITKLPTKLFLLKELKYLNLSATSALKEIPNGTISKLFKLRVLNLYKSHYGIWDVEDLNLERLEELEYLGITIYSEDVLHKLHSTDRLAESTRWLSLKHCKNMKSIQFSVFQHMVRLAVLFVHSCNELKEVIIDDIRTESTLQELTLADLPNLMEISVGPEPTRLHNLCDLTIEHCYELETVTCILQLQSLEKLVISHCYRMEQVVDEGIIDALQVKNLKAIYQDNEIQDNHEEAIGENDEIRGQKIGQNGVEEVICEAMSTQMGNTNAFQKLRMLILKDLTKLESICRVRHFPCLEIISVEHCPNLKRLPFDCNYQKLKLKQIRGSLDWWNRLVWEEAHLSTVFSEHFDPIL